MRSSPDADGACASISWNAAYDGAISMRASASGVNSASCSAGVKEPSHAAWRSTGPKSMPAMKRLSRSEEHTLNSSHTVISYAVFCLKKKINLDSGICMRVVLVFAEGGVEMDEVA